MNEEYLERRQWFMNHIEQWIWRNKISCTCKSCVSGYENGVFVYDEIHAIYLHDVEGCSQGKLKYFDTKEERDKFEEKIK